MLALRLLLNARREARLAGMARTQLELALLKILHTAALIPAEELRGLLGSAPTVRADAPAAPRSERRLVPPPLAARAQALSTPVATPATAPTTPAIPAAPVAKPVSASAPVAPPISAVPPARVASVLPSQLTLESISAGWPKFLALLSEQKKRLAGLLEGAEPVAFGQGTLQVRLRAGADFARQSLEDKSKSAVLEESFLGVFGTPVNMQFACAPAGTAQTTTTQSPERDPGAMKLMNAFDGTLVHREDKDRKE
jgi:hypothetical protein